MSKINDAREILSSVGVPERQKNDLCCYTLLAMAGIGENDLWSSALNEWIRIHGIIAFIREKYGISYAENSRETIRKQALHHFRNAAVIEDNGRATNSPNYCYRITLEMLKLIQSFGCADWEKEKLCFLSRHKSLAELYKSKREIKKIPVKINGAEFMFSHGSHNMLQKLVLEEFAPRFVPVSECLYIGDTAKKDLMKNDKRLAMLGFNVNVHDKMPDIILYDEKINTLFFIECVTSVGPVTQERIIEIEAMTENVRTRKVYITAFPDFRTFKRFAELIAWETEIWIAENPGHMIHMNGKKFLEAINADNNQQ